MASPRSSVRSELEEFRDDLGALRDDVRDLVSALRDAGESSLRKASRAASRLAENGVATVKETASKVGEKVGDGATRLEEGAREGIQAHPWWTVFGAVGLGLLAGRFLDRR